MTKNNKLPQYSIMLLSIFLFFGCAPAPVLDDIATIPPEPTSTPNPTVTAIIPPSHTPSPTITPTPLVPELGQVLFSEGFEDITFPFDFWGPGRIESGTLILEREPDYVPPPHLWPYGGINKSSPVLPDVTTVILFKKTGNATFNIGYHIGDYSTEKVSRFSYNSGKGTWDIYHGSTQDVEEIPARQSDFNQWHYFSITRSANGDFDARIWERDNPGNTFKFHGNLGPEWGTLEFTFFADYHLGSFVLDEYQELH